MRDSGRGCLGGASRLLLTLVKKCAHHRDNCRPDHDARHCRMPENERHHTYRQGRKRENDRSALPDPVALDGALKAGHLVFATVLSFQFPLLHNSLGQIWNDLPKSLKRLWRWERSFPRLVDLNGLRNLLLAPRRRWRLLITISSRHVHARVVSRGACRRLHALRRHAARPYRIGVDIAQAPKSAR